MCMLQPANKHEPKLLLCNLASARGSQKKVEHIDLGKLIFQILVSVSKVASSGQLSSCIFKQLSTAFKMEFNSFQSFWRPTHKMQNPAAQSCIPRKTSGVKAKATPTSLPNTQCSTLLWHRCCWVSQSSRARWTKEKKKPKSPTGCYQTCQTSKSEPQNPVLVLIATTLQPNVFSIFICINTFLTTHQNNYFIWSCFKVH